MKKFTIILTVLIAMTIKTNAQIPNGGFETWENYVDDYTGYVYQKPDLWNGALPNGWIPSYSIQKNPESYPAGTGQYSMKIQPDIANGVRGVAGSYDSTCIIVNGQLPPTFAINYRPASLYLYYKCFPFGGDTIMCTAYFYKNGVVIGNSVFETTTTVPTWTPLEIPTHYTTSDIPDSATIFFSTAIYILHSSESTLYVDNLSFTGFVTSNPEIKSENTNFNLYPNPASDIVTLNIENKNNAGLTLNIYSLAGTLVKSEILKQNQRQINIVDLSDGIYIVEIKSKEWTEKRKLKIQR